MKQPSQISYHSIGHQSVKGNMHRYVAQSKATSIITLCPVCAAQN